MTDRVKVLFVITKSEPGGAQQYVFDMATSLDKSVYAVAVAAGGRGPLLERLVRTGITVYHIDDLVWGIAPHHDLRALLALRGVIRRGRFHIVHANSAKAGLIARIAAWLCHTPVVIYTVHGFYFHHYSSRLAFLAGWLTERLLALITDCLIAVSRADARRIEQLGLIAKRKIALIPNGVDAPAAQGASELAADGDAGNCPAPNCLEQARLRSALGLATDAIVVGSVSRLAPLKGMDHLIAALPAIAKEVPNVHLILVGDGPLEARLRRLAREHGVEDRISFLGFRDDVCALLLLFAVVVFPSLKEGLPITVLEAMAMARPLVVSDIDGHDELVEPGDSGLLVPPGDPAAIAAAVVALLREPERAARLGAAARERCRTSFSLDAMVHGTESLYRELLARKRVRSLAAR